MLILLYDAAFTSYGAFWLSYATILIPNSGILTAYANPDDLGNALGLYLIVCACLVSTLFLVLTSVFFKGFIFTTLLMFGAIRRNISFCLLLGFLSLTFLLLACGEFSGKVREFFYTTCMRISWLIP